MINAIAKLTVLLHAFNDGTWEEDFIYTMQDGTEVRRGCRYQLNTIISEINKYAINTSIANACKSINAEKEKYKTLATDCPPPCCCFESYCRRYFGDSYYDRRPIEVVQSEAALLRTVINKTLREEEQKRNEIYSSRVEPVVQSYQSIDR